MQLSKKILKDIKAKPGLVIPTEELLSLPEKVLQFGTGVLLRGLPDYFIDKANRQGIFNGRVVIVKSTSHGITDAYEEQDGLYTLCVRGVENGKKSEETIINSSVSRVLSANDDWDSVLDCAANPDMQVIISNTTEVGIALVEDDVRNSPPLSFPGKLLSFLNERYKVFNGDESKGMVIIPTELITENGNKLKEIILKLANMNKLDEAFVQWLERSNHFCNSLVDRIVPGKLPVAEQEKTENLLGYSDELMILSEPFRLWAIESADPRVRQILSFAKADPGMVIAPSIEKFRELKLRILNGSHSFSCALAHLAGFTTVYEAMENPVFSRYIQELVTGEIAPSIVDDNLSYSEAIEFAGKVKDRFSNPYLEHKWLSISMQYTSKMKLRNLPLLKKYYALKNQAPEHMALGFAAYILFMRSKHGNDNNYQAEWKGKIYNVSDDHAAKLASLWSVHDSTSIAEAVLSDESLWGTKLSLYPGFTAAVTNFIKLLEQDGAVNTIKNLALNKSVA